jgi:hypothetical protein
MNLENANAALFAAIAQAQGEVENATKSATNPHFKSRYADLAEVLNTVRPTFARHGLAIIQSVSSDQQLVTVATTIAHKEGGFVTSSMSCTLPTSKIQDLGSMVTYLRRYSVAAMTCISQEDDDGNTASQRPAKASTEPQKPSPTQALTEAATVAQGGTEALKAWFGGLTKSEREAIAASAEWTTIKAAAGKVQP